MEKKVELERMIIQLKLTKRELVLLGKNTKQVDEQIASIEKKLKLENDNKLND